MQAAMLRRLAVKLHQEYADVQADLTQSYEQLVSGGPVPASSKVARRSAAAASVEEVRDEGSFDRLLSAVPARAAPQEGGSGSQALTLYSGGVAAASLAGGGGRLQLSAASAAAAGADSAARLSQSLIVRARQALPQPQWHAPWKLMRVITGGHQGWVRSVAVSPDNEWFVTGSLDRTIKIWDLASGKLRLTLTGHISAVRSLCVSERHPYLFSAGEDKQVRCWDLETNKTIRSYHGHLSGVYSMALHPSIDVLITGGRDSVARVWDMRTKAQAMVLSGHRNTVASLLAQSPDPQVISGSMDKTVRLWDLRNAKTDVTLTHHKKSVRAMALHPTKFTFASASADSIKQWELPNGNFLQNLAGHHTIINSLSTNREGVCVSGGDDGSMYLWDWDTGYNFQKIQTRVQPGSMESEAGIFCSTFDRTGYRLIVGEADKTIKVYKPDDEATPESHPVDYRPSVLKRSRY